MSDQLMALLPMRDRGPVNTTRQIMTRLTSIAVILSRTAPDLRTCQYLDPQLVNSEGVLDQEVRVRISDTPVRQDLVKAHIGQRDAQFLDRSVGPTGHWNACLVEGLSAALVLRSAQLAQCELCVISA